MENVTPAILSQTNEKSLKELSPQEFQQLLSFWFQDRGIVQDMKSYLKFQMINVLKNTVIGKNIRNRVPASYSLAQQAIHLIVAEYLLQNQCHFTLSLFSNEVNLTNIIPLEKRFLSKDNTEATNVFTKENLINILELIGVSRNSVYFTKIVNQYFDNQMETLLSCIIALIGKNITEQNSKNEECKSDIDCGSDFMGNISQVLQSSNISQETRNKLLHSIKLCYDLKIKSFENQCIKLINKFKKELSIRDKTIRDEGKQKRSLEKKLIKLQKENDSLRQEINMLSKEERVEIENGRPVCSLNHCNEKCTTAVGLFETYKKEIEELKKENNNQKEEIQRLSLNCNELLKEFNCCQSKINLVNTKIQDDTVEESDLFATGFINKNSEIISSDSETTVTEEILHQAREKLKLLEEESKALDIRFSQFVIK